MRTFKYSDDKSYKFWNIELQGNRFTVSFGRIGTAGQTQAKTFADATEAQAAHDKLVTEKLAKGYVETTPTATSAAASTATVLERALVDDPDDLAAHSAYADYQAEQGDPRGEFIQVQLALEDPNRPAKERNELRKREKDLLEQHGREWLAGLAEYLLDQRDVREDRLEMKQGYEFQFARGWLDALRVPQLRVRFARVLAAAPQTRLLRRLAIEGDAYEEAGEFDPGPDIPEDSHSPQLYPLLRSQYLGNLRVFHLGEPMEEHQGEEYSNCHTSGEAAAALVQQMPRLEELYLLAHRVDMKKLFALKTLTRLRILQIYHCTQYPLEALARNAALGRLTHLLLFPHALEPDDDAAYINLAGVRAVVRSPHLTSLTHLRVRLCDMGDEACDEIVRSGILKRLKMLDVMHGRITDDGARILAASPDLHHLELLEISHNRVTDTGVQALRATGVRVQSRQQHSPDGDESEYLSAGDME